MELLMSLFDEWNDKYGDKGLGDTVSRVIDKATFGMIPECGGCKSRKKYLNDLLSYDDCEGCNR
tara:strand:+ start:20799 stop:20990 length:192 start_codon:yes stop_codon:yes gene_type:complete